jgi:cell division protein FtsN
MKVTKRDVLAVAVVIIVIVVFIMSAAHKKPKQVPIDDKHHAFYQSVEKGQDRVEVEKGCVICHNPQAIPLSKQHPPKEQCLICHRLNYATQ